MQQMVLAANIHELLNHLDNKMNENCVSMSSSFLNVKIGMFPVRAPAGVLPI